MPFASRTQFQVTNLRICFGCNFLKHYSFPLAAADLPPPVPSPAPAPSQLAPFIAPLHHPMLPSRPVRPPSLQAQLPDTAEDCGTAGGCSALDLLVHNPQADL